MRIRERGDYPEPCAAWCEGGEGACGRVFPIFLCMPELDSQYSHSFVSSAQNAGLRLWDHLRHSNGDGDGHVTATVSLQFVLHRIRVIETT